MGKHLNFVHNDQIWKDHVQMEMASISKTWPERWGFLIKEYNQMNRKLGFGEDDNKEYLEKVEIKEVKLPPIKGAAESYPKTTAHLIGWKSTDPHYGLEKYGKYSRGRVDPFNRFRWPNQGV